LGIFEKASKTHLGNIKFEPIHETESYAVIGIMIGDLQWRGRRVSGEVIDASVKAVYQKRSIAEFVLEVEATKKPSIRASQKTGFQINPTVRISVPVAALGATVVEKHFTLSRPDGGVDSTFSMEPAELRQLVAETKRAWQSLGGVSYGPTEGEKKSLQFRRSLYVVEDMEPGDIFTKENLRAIRPGLGLPPKYFDSFLGGRVERGVKRGTPLSWDHIAPDQIRSPKPL